MLVTAVGIVVAAAAIAATAHALWQLDAARVLQGIAAGLVSATATAALTALPTRTDTARRSDPAQRCRVLSPSGRRPRS
ncbi:hypothetical protein [Pseudonocardia sp. GCM10023141]|uniref:hypothetical protein n=1 Tax=Pseudonocardia sp. GCM10023141 TaxID=3252653 RepID=UPI003605DA7A